MIEIKCDECGKELRDGYDVFCAECACELNNEIDELEKQIVKLQEEIKAFELREIEQGEL